MLKDEKVRQALNYATDKEGIIRAVLFGHGKQALSPLFLANYTNEEYGYPYDMDKAKALIAKSGFPKGGTLNATYVGGDSIAQQTLTILKDQWSKLGITLNLKPIEEGVYFSTWSSGKFDLMWVKATNDIYDPAENLHFEMMGKEGGSDSGFTGYENPALNKLVLAAEKEPNTTKRAALYKKIQQIYMADGPQVYLFHPSNLWATSSNVHGFQIYKTGLHPFMNTWIGRVASARACRRGAREALRRHSSLAMAIYVAKRLGYSLITLVLVSFTVFFLIHLIPGDPARILLGLRATPRVGRARSGTSSGSTARSSRSTGSSWRTSSTATSGRSLRYQTPVSASIFDRLPATLFLIALLRGADAARRAAARPDRGAEAREARRPHDPCRRGRRDGDPDVLDRDGCSSCSSACTGRSSRRPATARRSASTCRRSSFRR